ncbi:MAG TPA: hypothetical protein VHC97_25510 [Thermoanaerobaculia bacterium]|nr:hypothetical protein [Thermoanaerobaculia bacterium]
MNSGFLGKPFKLKVALSTGAGIQNAAMSPGGDQWLLQAGRTVRLFVNGEEKALPPLPWLPNTVTFLRDTPMVGVLPFPVPGSFSDLEKLGTPPRVLRLDDDRWNPMIQPKGASVAELLGEKADTGELNDAVADVSLFMTGDRQGKLWTAQQFAYRVERFSPAGRRLFAMTVDGGKVRKEGESKGIEVKRKDDAQNPVKATDNPKAEKGTYFPFTAVPVFLDLAEGRDGKIYFLIRLSGGKAALDRYDPVQSILERVPLRLNAEGRFTLAAGKDALYLAAWDGRKGRWKLDWGVLDQGKWEEVDMQVSGSSGASAP